jgi:hypothetical protein
MAEIGGRQVDADFMRQSDVLAASLDVDALSFDQVMYLLRTYTRNILLSEKVMDALQIEPGLRDKFQRLLSRAENYEAGDPSQCEADRVEAWQLQMSLPKTTKDSVLAEIIVLCMYDRASAEFDTFGPAAMIESIMTSIAGLGDGYCKSFVDFAIAQKGERRFLDLADKA